MDLCGRRGPEIVYSVLIGLVNHHAVGGLVDYPISGRHCGREKTLERAVQQWVVDQ